MASSTATADGGAGRLSVLEAAAELRGGATVLARRYCTSPIKIAKTFPEGGALGVMLMDASPGILAGDRYELNWEAEAGTHLVLTNQGFTKVHPCGPGQASSMESRYRIGAGAVVETMMKPVMLYRDAVFDNRTVVELAPGAIWMQGEVLCPGRLLRGEAFQYESLDNRLSVYYEGELIHHQRQLIRPGLQRMATQGAWGDYSHMGSFVVFSDRVTAGVLERLRKALEELPFAQEQLIAGAALTWRHGLAVSAAASSAWVLQQTLHEMWHATRRFLLGLGQSGMGKVG